MGWWAPLLPSEQLLDGASVLLRLLFAGRRLGPEALLWTQLRCCLSAPEVPGATPSNRPYRRHGRSKGHARRLSVPGSVAVRVLLAECCWMRVPSSVGGSVAGRVLLAKFCWHSVAYRILLADYCWQRVAGRKLMTEFSWQNVAGRMLLTKYCWNSVANWMLLAEFSGQSVPVRFPVRVLLAEHFSRCVHGRVFSAECSWWVPWRSVPGRQFLEECF